MIAIVGGGIGGLAAALGLARQGRAVTVFEQSARHEELGAGLQLGPNAVRALQSLGAWEAVAPHCVAPRALTVRKGETGGVLSETDLEAAFERRFGAPYRVAHRGDLMRGLLDTVKRTPGIDLVTGARIDHAEIAGGSLRLSVSGRGKMEPDAVVGADGVRSVVRQALIGDGPPRRSGYVYFRALVPTAKAPEGISREDVTVWLLPGAHIVHYPVSAGRQINIVAVSRGEWVGEGWSALAQHGDLDQPFAAGCQTLKSLLAAPANWLKWAGSVREPTPGWSKGRATLLGDAAHPIPPYLAQGSAMALEDAVVLGHACGASGDLAEAFKAYEAARFARTARMAKASVRQGELYHLEGVSRFFRDVALRVIPSEATIGRLSWLYSWMPP
ncbi:MAG: FAD-dependent monooxygenase [Hyphomicrobiales bacterium]